MARLIESGHRLEDLKGYTLAQVNLLLGAHQNLAQMRLHDELIIARAAQATPEGFRSVEASLKESHHG